MAVAIYLRVSTEEQRERQSIATQRDFAARYCDLHQFSIGHIYADDGVSGTVPLESRPEGGRMLYDARSKKFDQILIYKLDRLGRDTRLILNGVAELEKQGVRVRSMTEEFDTATSTGRLMLTMLSGFAAHERDVIRERSVAGANRVAESGAWLGGIVPYGYRKEGQRGQARLILSEMRIPGLDVSEADLIRQIYRMAAEQGKSCQKIANYLNALGAPCAYARDERLLLRGKRKVRTSGLWRPGRVRAILTNTTYMGRHEFGKRSQTAGRKLIEREVSAIVTRETWTKAQQTLQRNFLFGRRNARNHYLLRGLLKCGLCGLNWSGAASGNSDGTGTVKLYYRCNGKQTSRWPYSKTGRPCLSKDIDGAYLEERVWADVEGFLRNPGEVLIRLQAKFTQNAAALTANSPSPQNLEAELANKKIERERILTLFRRARIDETTLDRQLEEIQQEEGELRAKLRTISERGDATTAHIASLRTAEGLLAELCRRLKESDSWEFKRRIVEILVAEVRVDLVEEDGERRAVATVTYRFGETNTAESAPSLSEMHEHIVESRRAAPDSLGHHIRKRRLSLKLRQKDVAPQFGVDTTTVHNWETGTRAPRLESVPKIIAFLGYNPLPAAATTPERLQVCRKVLGLSQKELAARLCVDPSTLAHWEQGRHAPAAIYTRRIDEFLSSCVW